MTQHLKPPLRFHTNAPSVNAPRHRARHVSSQLAVDESGKEHLLLHFYVESMQPIKSHSDEPSVSMSDLSFASVYEWSKSHAQNAIDSSKRAFAYLVGSPSPPLEVLSRTDGAAGSTSASSGVRHTDIGKPSKEGPSAWSFAGLFSGLRRTGSAVEKEESTPSAQFTEGEAHADLVKDENGNFTYRYLLVELPRESVVLLRFMPAY